MLLLLDVILYDNLDGNENVVYNDDKLDNDYDDNELEYDDRMLMLLIISPLLLLVFSYLISFIWCF